MKKNIHYNNCQIFIYFVDKCKRKCVPIGICNAYNKAHMTQDESECDSNPLLIMETKNNKLGSIDEWYLEIIFKSHDKSSRMTSQF